MLRCSMGIRKTHCGFNWTSLVAQMVENLPTMWEIWARSLGWEDALEEHVVAHSSILAGESHGQRSL